MTSAKHTHSIHIDAPVKEVFYYLEDPAHFIAPRSWAPSPNPATITCHCIVFPSGSGLRHVREGGCVCDD